MEGTTSEDPDVALADHLMSEEEVDLKTMIKARTAQAIRTATGGADSTFTLLDSIRSSCNSQLLLTKDLLGAVTVLAREQRRTNALLEQVLASQQKATGMAAHTLVSAKVHEEKRESGQGASGDSSYTLNGVNVGTKYDAVACVCFRVVEMFRSSVHRVPAYSEISPHSFNVTFQKLRSVAGVLAKAELNAGGLVEGKIEVPDFSSAHVKRCMRVLAGVGTSSVIPSSTDLQSLQLNMDVGNFLTQCISVMSRAELVPGIMCPASTALFACIRERGLTFSEDQGESYIYIPDPSRIVRASKKPKSAVVRTVESLNVPNTNKYIEKALSQGLDVAKEFLGSIPAPKKK